MRIVKRVRGSAPSGFSRTRAEPPQKKRNALILPRRLSAGPTKKVPPHRQDKTEKRKAEF